MKPHPKPEKKEKEKISAWEFRQKYGTKKIKNRSNKPVKKFKSASERFYKSNAWIWFRRYILTKYCDPKTMTVPNYTGTEFLPIKGKNTHVGHYVKVFEGNNSQMSTAFDERNCLPQSHRDNRYYGGKPDLMAVQIDLIHGSGTSEGLRISSKRWVKHTDSDYKEIAEQYKQKTYELIKDKGMGKWWN